MILDAALKAIEPRPAMRTLDWAREYVFTYLGQPYSDFAYPHLGAPGGPFDAFDCPQYFDIWLQWGSRLGKTFAGQVAMMRQADYKPLWPMMFASSDEKLATEVIDRSHRMLERCPRLAHRLLPRHLRRQDRISLTTCRVTGAWARSVSTLADKAVRFGHANEIDKWEHEGAAKNTAKEADPLKLFDDRFKEFPTFKRWKESTPAQKSTSRVERGRLGSCNASLWVPCPKCGRYQTLDMGYGSETRGCIIWEKNAIGKSDKDIARATARYVCIHCEKELHDEHRGTMMRLGVWVPEGCSVDDGKARRAAEEWREPGRPVWGGWKESDWITGTPLRDGRDWGSQLSSLYALSLSWGAVAAEFIDTKERPQNLRDFKNQWLAETWEPIRRETTVQKLGERIISNVPREKVPAWASMLTIGIDRQGEDLDRFPWVIDAWGPRQRCATIAYGEVGMFADLLPILLAQHADGGPSLRVACGLFDSNYRPKGVHEFCIDAQRRGVNIWPCKGSQMSLNCDFRVSTLGKDTSMPGGKLYIVDTIRSQDWIEAQLRTKSKDDADGYSLHAGSQLEHRDFLEQLLNDAAIHDEDSSNNAREKWERINENVPNDYRDCRRYAYVAMLAVTGGNVLPRNYRPARPKEPEEPSRVRELRIRQR